MHDRGGGRLLDRQHRRRSGERPLSRDRSKTNKRRVGIGRLERQTIGRNPWDASLRQDNASTGQNGGQKNPEKRKRIQHLGSNFTSA
jgi:hypothetical protein